MKYLSIFVLAVFINFTALPSIAVIFDWEIPTLNNNISEGKWSTFLTVCKYSFFN